VLGVYNTHFDSSAWDEPHIKGTQTVNTVVLIEVADGSEIQLDDTSYRYRWSSTDPEKNGDEVRRSEERRQQALRVRGA